MAQSQRTNNAIFVTVLLPPNVIWLRYKKNKGNFREKKCTLKAEHVAAASSGARHPGLS